MFCTVLIRADRGQLLKGIQNEVFVEKPEGDDKGV
jgi:hypothetical protein